MNHFQTVRLNALKRLPDRTYRLTSKLNGNALCVACSSYNECPKASTVKTCAEFIPVFVFSDPTNLDNQSFNTIRLGKAWHERLEPGQTISLYDAKNDHKFNMKVVSVHWSIDKEDLLEDHAALNHLGKTYNNPASDLKKKLINMYGKNFFANAKGLTALYLERI